MTGYTQDGPDLQRMVDELVKDHVHREPYILRGQLSGLGRVAHHQTRVPALIDQLLEPAPGGKGELSGTEHQARPAVRIEAHDTIELIAMEAGEWIGRLGGVKPADVIDSGRKHHALRGSGAKRALVILRSLHAGLVGADSCGREHGRKVEVLLDPESDSKDSLLGELEAETGFDSKDSHLPTEREWCCTDHHVEADVRRWWRQARIISGWDSPTYRPYASCPSCSNRKGLRINLTAHSAVCVECRNVWGPETIGLLAEHIRAEKEGTDEEAEQEDSLEVG